jgi:hypothetical protein
MSTPQVQRPRFDLGRVFITPGARALLGGPFVAEVTARRYIARHLKEDWAEMDEHDQQANRDAIERGERVFSAFTHQGERLYVITEADRASTTILLPEEY